ncbi:MAG: uridine kinase [Candidatus Cloacimonetes bacterium]|nr:uridine kinase [Candidatus Cloacimonadota bacterium]MCF7813297.1 uridine kinase [Candidatus Cloacimonadota bacterium]MCF7867372.1 uridine kinase [Candidatus Cloacimonadota bacterium]MCF7882806.1 uridine kinase [Candidatus Cloacimonadota bacterium]
MSHPVVIGISGGTGSGKSTITEAIQKQVDCEITLIQQDNYYKSFGHLPKKEREKINFDHPATFDTELLIEHVSHLKKSIPIEMPLYDFKTHMRTNETVTKKPSRIIILEGILIFENPDLRDLMDIKIFVDTDADVRILRRIVRDMNERERTLESVLEQYYNTVRPMHIEFVEPSKKYANIIIPEGGQNTIGIDMIVAKINDISKK